LCSSGGRGTLPLLSCTGILTLIIPCSEASLKKLQHVADATLLHAAVDCHAALIILFLEWNKEYNSYQHGFFWIGLRDKGAESLEESLCWSQGCFV